MTTYYVRKSGADGNAGTSPATAWLTINKAAQTVAAGDTVYVGAGTYREMPVLVTPGTAGNQITYVGDVSGEQTGDAGKVIITAYNGEQVATFARASAIDADAVNAFQYTTLRGFTMIGGTSSVIDAASSNVETFVGTIIEDCTLMQGHSTAFSHVLYFDYNALATNVSPGLIIRRNTFIGAGMRLDHDGHADTSFDAGVLIENNVFWGCAISNLSSQLGALNWELNVVGTVKPKMGVFRNNTILFSYYGVEVDTSAAEASVNAYNNVFYFVVRSLSAGSITTPSQITSNYNTHFNCGTPYTNTTIGGHDRVNNGPAQLFGGIADMDLYANWGWSPYLPQEAIVQYDLAGAGGFMSDLSDPNPAVSITEDMYGNPRPMGMGTRNFYFDASDAAVFDPEGVWTDDANIADGNITTAATSSTAGSPNYLMIEGTNAPATGPDIIAVYVRFYSTAQSDVTMEVRTDGWDESLVSSAAVNVIGWQPHIGLTTPTGGWTWPKVQALEARLHATTVPDGAAISFVELHVQSRGDALPSQADRGAIEARSRPQRNTGTVFEGDNSMQIRGAGFHDMVIPVKAQATTITVQARYDSNYTGTKPSLSILDIPGVSDITDTMAAAADTWEELTSGEFTPTSDGVARIRLTSSDTSATGIAFFDALSYA